MPESLSPDPTRSTIAPWTAAQTRAQFAAIAWLRWRITVNSFRGKRGAGELTARLLVYFIFAAITLGPTAGAGVLAFSFTSGGHLERLAYLLWGIFILCQLLNIQLGQPGTAFDPARLIRFPIGLGSYAAIRLFFGLLTPGNVIALLTSFAAALGILLAAPQLWWAALLGLAVFAAANVLFSRMVFAWVDRWLATRRAREIFTALVFAVSLGFQWLNFSYNPAFGHQHRQARAAQRLNALAHVYRRAKPFLHALPPELTTTALICAHQGHLGGFINRTLGCLLFSAAFLAVFSVRMRTEFRGESLSDRAIGVSRRLRQPAKRRPKFTVLPAVLAESDAAQPGARAVGPSALAPARQRGFEVPPVVSAVLGKELIYVRRSSGILYSLVAPVVLVFLFAGRMALRGSSEWVFPAALAYTMLGVAPLSYNSFGLEGAGSQLYFLAPIHLREVFLAKNLIHFFLALVEAAAVFGIISYVGAVPTPAIAASTLLWTAATLLFSATLGNHRSVSAPRRIKAARAGGKQASSLSALLGMGLLLLSVAAASVVAVPCLYFHHEWIMVAGFAGFFAAALGVYLHTLASMERYALQHREQLFSELCKSE